jgi:phage repressor protein C with HTH and peptisase S24 domain
MNALTYGLRVTSDDLYPFARRGSVLIVDPDTDCAMGQCVVLALTTGEMLVRELVDRTADSVTVTDIHRRSRQTFAWAEVDAMHHIGGVMASSASALRSAERGAA